ncbi:MAG: TrmH family RNA methyltransferase [Actinomycetota bacterium]
MSGSLITSVRNPRVADAVKLKKRAFRERDRRFLVEGAQAVGEALAGPGLSTLFVSGPNGDQPLVSRAERAGTATFEVSGGVMEHLTSTVTPPGLVGVSRFVDVGMPDVASASLACILYAVRDPGNAGTVLRSADAAGAEAVVFSTSSVDVYNPKAVRSSAGSLFHVPVVRDAEIHEAVDAFRQGGATVYAAAAHAEGDLYSLDLSRPSVFLFGNEAWGLPDDVVSLADATVRVPIAGAAESLNLAAAATLCLFEAARQRRHGGPGDLESVIAAAAHDIRSPITTLGGFALTLLNRWQTMDDEQRELMLKGIVFDAERMNLKVKHLVEAARIAAGRLEIAREKVDVGETIGIVASFLASNPDHPDVVWEGEETTLFTDGERLAEAVNGLIEAAAWWGHEGPIRITAVRRGESVDIEVFRSGTNLSTRDADGLFAPRPPGSGAGSKIGLFVARGVAGALGGSATAEIDDGLRLRLRLPAEMPGPGR